MKSSKRAQQAYETLRTDAYKLIPTLLETELHLIAQRINPEVSQTASQYVVFEEASFPDGDSLLRSRTSGYSFWGMVPALFFFRLHADHYSTDNHEVRLVFEIQRSKADARKVWIDCESGLPWRPRSVMKLRNNLTPERRAEIEAFERHADAAAREALKEIKSGKLSAGAAARSASGFSASSAAPAINSAAGVAMKASGVMHNGDCHSARCSSPGGQP